MIFFGCLTICQQCLKGNDIFIYVKRIHNNFVIFSSIRCFCFIKAEGASSIDAPSAFIYLLLFSVSAEMFHQFAGSGK